MKTDTRPRVATPDEVLANFDALPDSAYVDVKVVAKLEQTHQNTIWNRVKKSSFPAPVKTSPQSSRWKVGALRAHYAKLEQAAA